MKTVLLTTSPKKHSRWANSSYFLWLTGLQIRKKDKICLNLKGKKDYNSIFAVCKNADVLVIAMPVYVDAIPFHVLRFLQEAQKEADNWHCKVYVVTNCGFFEGEQCKLLLNQVACWCKRCRLEYGGGLGVGAGEMLGVLRITNLIFAIICAFLQFTVTAIHLTLTSQFSVLGALSGINLISFCINIGLFLLWSMGLFINTALFGKSIRSVKTVNDQFTTVWFCGWPLFKYFATVFWIVRAAWNRVPIWKMKKQIAISLNSESTNECIYTK